MTYAASSLGSEFDAFLFAPIGCDKNEMALSVVSALARLDVDPWKEAAALARLPQAAATGRLTALLADLPVDTQVLHPGEGEARLVALLPRFHIPERTSPRLVQAAAAVPNYHVIAFIVFAVLVCSVQYVVASRLASAPVEKASVAAPNKPLKAANSAAP